MDGAERCYSGAGLMHEEVFDESLLQSCHTSGRWRLSEATVTPRSLGRRTRRPVATARVAVVLTAAVCGVLGGAPGPVWALDCGGRLVSEGQALWEVQAICGEPTQVDDTVEIVLRPVYDVFGRVVDYFPVEVPKSVWTYNFGPSRLVYRLTFREGKVVHIETGGYGH
jgi:uncharacterized protein DUF2845